MRARLIRSLVLAAGVSAGAPLAGGCVVQARGAVVVDEAPPPPRRVRVAARPGFVRVDGVWVSRGGRWAWREGTWVRSRPGYVYVQGRWIRRAGRWHWVEPRWERSHRGRARGQVDRRDHRRARPAGPDLRDHRSER